MECAVSMFGVLASFENLFKKYGELDSFLRDSLGVEAHLSNSSGCICQVQAEDLYKKHTKQKRQDVVVQ